VDSKGGARSGSCPTHYGDQRRRPFDTVCFHCQQAAEKYLKSLLTSLNIQASRTHDLNALMALLPADQDFPVSRAEIVELNPYAVAVRYADDWREPSLADAERALNLALEVRTAVRKMLPPAALI